MDGWATQASVSTPAAAAAAEANQPREWRKSTTGSFKLIGPILHKEVFASQGKTPYFNSPYTSTNNSSFSNNVNLPYNYTNSRGFQDYCLDPQSNVRLYSPDEVNRIVSKVTESTEQRLRASNETSFRSSTHCAQNKHNLAFIEDDVSSEFSRGRVIPPTKEILSNVEPKINKIQQV